VITFWEENMRISKTLVGSALVALGVLSSASTALAEYPERPIALIVPWGAGGGTDATGRIIASLLQEELGQPVNVINRTGGSGVVGHTAIATAPADGYTIGVATVEIGMMHWAGLTKLTHEAYEPIALYNSDPAGILVAADSELSSVEDLFAAAAANPGDLKGSGSGQGGIWHLALAGMLNAQGLNASDVPWVPSKGSAAALQELVAGGVDVVTSSVVEASGLIDAGRVKALAVMSSDRIGAFADVPTLAEAGGSDWETAAWRGIVAPDGIPEDVKARLKEAMTNVWNSDQFIEFMNGRGFGLTYLEGDEFGEWMASSDAAFGDVMTAVGLAN
jgi:tripartite-type tricarboxylate transporter receptor subunit TctC